MLCVIFICIDVLPFLIIFTFLPIPYFLFTFFVVYLLPHCSLITNRNFITPVLLAFSWRNVTIYYERQVFCHEDCKWNQMIYSVRSFHSARRNNRFSFYVLIAKRRKHTLWPCSPPVVSIRTKDKGKRILFTIIFRYTDNESLYDFLLDYLLNCFYKFYHDCV